MSSDDRSTPPDTEQLAQARFRELASLLPDYVVMIDRQRRYKWVNRVAAGLSEDQVRGRRVDDFIAAEDLPRAIECIERCFETGEQTEYQVSAYGDGKEEWYFESRVVPATDDNGEPAALILTRNCTKQVAAENRFRRLLEVSPDVILTIDETATILYVNHIHPSLAERAVVGSRIFDFIPEDARAQATIAVKAALEEGVAGAWESSSPIPGSERFSARILPVDGPESARALLIVQDISAQVRAARALKASEERLSRVMGVSQMGLYQIDVQENLAEVSPAFAERFGLSTIIKPQDWQERIHPDDQKAASAGMMSLAEGREQSVELEYRMRTKDGEYRRFRDRMAQTSSGKIAGLVEDVTEVRELEDHRLELQSQLEQTQRLESIGLLAGGVAHDFNNLLTVILNGTHLANRVLTAGRDPSEELEQVMAAANRAAELTQQLLAFSRRSALRVAPLDIVELVEQVVAMARRVIPETISLSFTPPPTRAVVRGDRQQLEQALLNLCINARDAMEDGGSLSITITCEGPKVSIRVADSGQGIEAANLERIFEPFFTTKPVGAGTGLGLAMVHGIVQQHHGTITVSSTKEQGTEFEIQLPVTDAEQEVSPLPRSQPLTGTARILVAEDEEMVRDVVTRLLEEAGYEVVSARDGLEAAEIFEAQDGKFDLLLFDAVMPRLNGWQAYERISETSPTVRILFSSGYAATAFPKEQAVPPRLVKKPYEPHVLLQAVADALAAT